MTGQINDGFLYKGERYYLVGISGGQEDLFDVSDYNLQPYSSCIACWRGYQLFYGVFDSHLVVQTLLINIHEEQEINGMKPRKLGKPDFQSTEIEANANFFKFHYPEINIKLKFTGTILIAKDFIQEMYVHMGFQRPMAYRTVIELKFRKGKLVSEKDKSKAMAEYRDGDPYKDAQPSTRSSDDTKEWITKTFSRSYESDDEEE